jgi:hypothetical protein
VAPSGAALALLPAAYAAAGLLVVAGALKLGRPGSARAALATAGWGVPAPLVRSLGAAEIVLGAAFVLRPGVVTAAAAAAAYACFALFVVRLLRRARAGVECGCFGTAGGEASAFHVWLNGALCALCAAAALAPPPAPSWIAARAPLFAFALVAGIGATVYATVVAFAAVPRAWASYTPEEPR